MESVFNFANPYRRAVAGREKVGDYTIDTCYTSDGGWETAIWKGHGSLITVEHYTSETEAVEGHNKWCIICSDEPKGFWDVDMREYVRV